MPTLFLATAAIRSVADPHAWASAPQHKLATFGEEKNVRLKITDLTDRMAQQLPDRVRDLLELAALVYAADQSCRRCNGTKLDYGDKWRRRFRFEVAVRDVAFWSSAGECLSEVLDFLSDDVYEFAFSNWARPLRFRSISISGQTPRPQTG